VLRALGCSTAEDFVCNDGTLLHTNLLRHGDVEGLKLLNTKFRIALASIPPSMPSFRTALHHAVESQSILAVQFVLQQKAPLNSKDAKGKTPLYLAATRGQWKMVDLILQQSPGTRLSLTQSDFGLTKTNWQDWE
jgi:ankyrin repeat protein